MERLYEKSQRLIQNQKINFVRYLFDSVNWSERAIMISGSREVGKTTLLLQYLKMNPEISQNSIYLSLDDIYFFENKLLDFADIFYKNGGKLLVLDEVHKYSDWSIEVKNILDSYPDLKIILTGSSALELFRGFGDLSRRVVRYNLHGLSFREYLELNNELKISKISIEDIISGQDEFVNEINSQIKILPEFNNYLKYGYYPYFIESIESFHQKLLNTINIILEVDIPSSESVNLKSINKLKKLFYVVASSVPFKPNITKISENLDVSRTTTMHYLDILSKSQIIQMLATEKSGLSKLTKPDKIYLNDTNQAYAFAENNVDIGNLRETFFLNQTLVVAKVFHTDKTDFCINNKYYLEVGGKNKGFSQISGLKNSYIAADNLEYYAAGKIPLWLFGFLY
ncbi:MAG: AAA family ATPase [Candidatus Kapabacteria bacterium]|nr:AAA family ATPase [Candidatus Kapabacteria bacterium]